MTKTLRGLIENYNNDLLTTINLQVVEKIFEHETIETEDLYGTVIKNSRFKSMKFTNIDFEKSAFYTSFLENCFFENINFQSSEFIESTFQNCVFVNCDFTDSEFKKKIFDACQFQTNEKGSTNFGDVNFISSHFDQTLFTGLPTLSVFGTVITNSKFSLSPRSIEFSGSFFLLDLVDPEKGIHELLTQTKVRSWEDEP